MTTGNIAAQLGVAPASATSMVAKLAGKELVVHPRYGAIEFTPAGRLAALSVVRRHRLIETFLLNELGYSWDEVHNEAEQLEHTVSDRFIEALAARLGHPAADPHGDPIPGPDGTVVMPPAIRLDRFADGGLPGARDREPDQRRGPGLVAPLHRARHRPRRRHRAAAPAAQRHRRHHDVGAARRFRVVGRGRRAGRPRPPSGSATAPAT